MNKSELIDVIAEAADISKAKATQALDSIINTVTSTLSKDSQVVLVGFGTFDVGKRKQRKGRNPRTGEEMVIPAAKVPRFRAGKKLKEAVNK